MPFCEDANDSTVARVVVYRFHDIADILPGPKEPKDFAKLDPLVNLYLTQRGTSIHTANVPMASKAKYWNQSNILVTSPVSARPQNMEISASMVLSTDPSML